MAARLGVSPEAVQLCREAELIDLHLDTFIPPRLWGYDIFTHHRRGPLGRHFFGHLDLPRIEAAGVSGGMWSITTNPFRSARSRWRIFQKNLKRFEGLVAASSGRMAFARTAAEYRAVRAADAHAVLLSIQGANALQAGDLAALPPGLITRVTLVHLTNAVYGATSSPVSRFRKRRGLSPAGRELVAALNAERIFVDLAHIHPEAFADALDAHASDRPPIVTHTGVQGVKPHWRNLDDGQIRAIADRGGVVGVMFHVPFLRPKGAADDVGLVVAHLEHIIHVAGEDVPAIGSDFDGAIRPPKDLASGDTYPRLVQALRNRGHGEDRVRKLLGLNFLKSWAHLRP
jgi:membrane dipeptidase